MTMQTDRNIGTKPVRQTGFTLIEVLIALVVLSIGLLGLAGLQTVGLRNNHSAYLRSQATLMAYDIADRMRANTAAVATDDYHSMAANNATLQTSCSSIAGCEPDEQAENDLKVWYTGVTNELPGGEGEVCLDSTPEDGDGESSPACDGSGRLYAVKIWWTDERDSSAAKKRFVMSFRP